MRISWLHCSGPCTWIEFGHPTDDTCCFTARITRRGPDWEAHLSGMRDSGKPGVVDVIDRREVWREREVAVALLLGWLRVYDLPTNLFA